MNTKPFALNSEDLTVFQTFHLKNTAAGRHFAKVFFLLVQVILLFIAISIAGLSRHFIIVFIIVFGLFQAGVLIQKLNNPLWPALGFTPARLLSDHLPTTIEVAPDAFVYRNAVEHISLHWSVVTMCHLGMHHIYVYWGQNLAFIIPKRAIDSDLAYQEFGRSLEQNWKSYRSPTL